MSRDIGLRDRFVQPFPLVLEHESVAKRFARELGLTFGDIDDLIDYLCREGRQREIFYLWRPFLPDPLDDMVLELAVEASAEFIVTHNLRDFRDVDQFGIEVIGPGAFLREHVLQGNPMSSISLRLPWGGTGAGG